MSPVRNSKCRQILVALVVALTFVSVLFGKFEKAQAAAFTVNSLGDTGAGSGTAGDLRYCITQANAAGGSNTITFSVTGTINLLSALPNLSSSALTINGPGANLLTIRRDSSVSTLRIFLVSSSGTITISDLTLANGNASGGAAVSKFSDGTLNINNCVLANNAGGAGGGGAIINNGNGPINITNSAFSGNSASGGEGGAIRHSGTGTVNINGSTFSGNSATNLACIHNNNTGAINITNTVITGNSATFDAGAISNSAGMVTVTGCAISNNMAGNVGGAIKNQTTGTVTVIDSTINDNSSGGVGGGIYNNTGTINVTRSTISGNSTSNASSSGGGIHNNGSGMINVTNSTISGNHAGSSALGGGLNFSNAGGAGQAVITSSTITGNTANTGGGVAVVSGISVTIKNTIIAGNTANNNSKDISGPLTSGGYNLIGNNTGGSLTPTTGDQIGTSGTPINPMLGALQNNGGPTFTHALLAGSPAIDKGNAFGLTADQRGAARPFDDPTIPPATEGDNSDIGAIEFEPSGPTAVDLAHFTASTYDAGVFIEWQTGFEAANLGFNLYRDESGRRVPVNSQMIAGSALLAGADTVLKSGRSYAFWDASIADYQSASYWLESVDLNGLSIWHGPYSAKFAGGAAPSRSDSPFIGQIAPAQAGQTRPVERAAEMPSTKPEQIAVQSGLAGQTAVKLWVKREGWYTLTASELAQAGLDPRANAAFLQLYVDGQQVAISVVADKAGQLAAIEFYGRGIDAAVTDCRVYWLITGKQPGLRIPLVKGAGYASAARSFLYTVERRDRMIYFSGLRNGERENFFGAVIASEPVEQTLRLEAVDQSASGAATMEVALQGVTTGPHKVWVYLNSVFAGELIFNSQAEGVASFSVSQSLLKSGNNDAKLVAQGGPSDISLIDSIRLAYWHSFAADNNALQFTALGKQSVTISGFTSGAIRVLDVTEPDAVEELAAKIEQQRSGYAVTVTSPEAGERRLLAFADGQSIKPARIAANRASNWRSATNGADLIVISRQDWLSSLQPLVLLRQSQGLKVAVVDVEDIYDEFGCGNKSPQAVKDFLYYAKTNWKIKPRYALIGGDASYDTKNYLGFGDWDIVPTKLIDTELMEAASDDWLVDFNNDGLPDVAIGRLPARSSEEVGVMVNKITDYEQSEPSHSVLLVADSNDGFDFEAASKGLRELLPAVLTVTEINRGQMDDATAKSRLLEAIGEGQKVINYTGHGSVSLWRGSLLTNDDARSLTNRERLPVFVMMTCLNGYFDDPALDSLAETLVKAEGGGAVAAWASSAMTQPEDQSLMNQQLYRLLLASPTLSLGEAVRGSKSAISNFDVRRTWILLGDPTMRLK